MSVVPPVPTNPSILPSISPVPASTASEFRPNINIALATVDSKVRLTQGNVQKILEKMGDGAVSGGTISVGTGLSVSIAALEAFVNSFVATDSATVVGGLTASATNSLYLREDGTFSARTSGTPDTTDGHGGYLLWGTATTDGSGVTAVSNTRASWAASIPGIGGTGSNFYVAAGAPSGGTGVNGDIYLNSTNGDLYKKAAGSWGSPAANIKGATGATGSTGASGATRVVVTLATVVRGVTASGQNYRLTADFSGVGVFGNVAYETILTCDNADLVISPDTNNRTTGKCAWVIYVPPTTVSTLNPTFSATLAGEGWTGGSTSAVTTTWSAIGQIA